MTKEQRESKNIIYADLKIVGEYYDSADKNMRSVAAYHMQQAVEKTIKLKAEINGLDLWGHDIKILIEKCKRNGVDIEVPSKIWDEADNITQWEVEGRYYPIRAVRKDSIKEIYDSTIEWLESGNTIK